MSTATLTRDQARNVALFSAADSSLGSGVEIEHEYIDGANGTGKVLVLKRVPVFRSGEFSDSMGYEHSWEDLHMQQMVAHFDLLKGSGIFANVPIRADHISPFSSIIEKVIGYHENLVAERMVSPVDGVEYTYLFSDMHIIRKDAQEAILSGLWRTRSAEIGPFITNGKAEFWPTYMGAAYVDIPAVEGLEQHLKQYTKSDNKFSLMMEEVMTDTKLPVPATQPPASAPKFEFSLPGVSSGAKTTDFQAVQALLNEQFAKITAHEATIATQTTELTALQAFAKETQDANRISFVEGLVAAGKVLAPQKEATLEFCKSMEPAQFESYTKLMADMPVNPIMGQYGTQPTVTGAPGAGPSAAEQKSDEVSVLVEQLSLHKRMGTAHSAIRKYPSFAKLTELDPAAAEALNLLK